VAKKMNNAGQPRLCHLSPSIFATVQLRLRRIEHADFARRLARIHRLPRGTYLPTPYRALPATALPRRAPRTCALHAAALRRCVYNLTRCRLPAYSTSLTFPSAAATHAHSTHLLCLLSFTCGLW